MMMSVITGRYRFRGWAARATWAAVLARPGPGGGEVGHGCGQGEQVADGGDDADPELHCCWSHHWLVVRGGRSVLTPPVCGCQEARDCALPCPPSPASVLAARPVPGGHGSAR